VKYETKDDMVTEQDVFDALRYRVEVNAYGTYNYYNKAGQLHREGGAAVEQANGGKRWYQNGILHRTDGPAIEWWNGDKFWYQNGLPHRTDGPAIELSNGGMEWWIDGEELTEAEFNQEVRQNV
jgi:hypothetical protein